MCFNFIIIIGGYRILRILYKDIIKHSDFDFDCKHFCFMCLYKLLQMNFVIILLLLRSCLILYNMDWTNILNDIHDGSISLGYDPIFNQPNNRPNIIYATTITAVMNTDNEPDINRIVDTIVAKHDEHVSEYPRGQSSMRLRKVKLNDYDVLLFKDKYFARYGVDDVFSKKLIYALEQRYFQFDPNGVVISMRDLDKIKLLKQ